MWSLLTKRCFLRDYGEGDSESFVRLNTDREARKHMGGALSASEAKMLFRQILKDTDPCQGLRWAVFARKSNEYLGHIFFLPWESKLDLEMGIILRTEHADNGLPEELGLAALEYLFHEGPVQKLVSTVGAEHSRSINLLKTLGMKCVERCQDDSEYYYVFELSKQCYLKSALALQAS